MARCSAEPTTSRSGCGSAPASQRAERRRAGRSRPPGRPRRTGRGAAAATSVDSIRRRERRVGGRAAAGRRRPGSRRSPRPPGRRPAASARMSSASLIETPPKPSSSRSVPFMTARERASPAASGRRSARAPRHGPTSRAWPRPRSPPGTGRARSPRAVARSPSTHRQPVVRVLVDGAQTREVLDRGGHPGRLEPADHRRAEPPDLGRVVAERADPDRRVAGFAGQVEDRARRRR